ncbi:39s ribosomal protein [Echinococcus multilocularis]|uniref:Large ribosomal subunit protein bL28m n=1 Tax=Echinococcus multilocularis TaxID=6211 RepID=A0A068YCN7_ECHMU|nr:39s ribosomal protein [Echinococcus multilocularis]
MSRFLFYPHACSVVQRLPKHFKKGYLKRCTPNSKLSYFEECGDQYIKAANNSIYPKEFFDIPPAIIFPEESQKSLWGGEGIVTGFTEVKRTHTRIPKTWGPELRQNLFYSEILNRWLMIIVSLTALKQIELMKGLDNYLLMTPENEINSRLGMHIKREILVQLSDPEFKKLKPAIAAKYAQFTIPGDEAEWVGLTLDEAIKKQMKIEHLRERAEASFPKKEIFTRALLKQLEADKGHPQLSRLSDPTSSSLRSTFSRFLYGQRGSKS